MKRIYGSATICLKDRCGLELEPGMSCSTEKLIIKFNLDITEIIADSRDYDELAQVWTKWRDSSGKPIRQLYRQFVDIGREVSLLNGFDDIEEFILYSWETTDFKQQIEDLWQELRPHYQLLHAFVRMKLRQRYGSRMPSDGTIPAHLLGNMWAQQWSNF